MDVLYVCCHGGLSISYVNNEKSGIFSVLFLLTDVEDVNNKELKLRLDEYFKKAMKRFFHRFFQQS